MPITQKIAWRNSIPIIFVRGTHNEVGFDVGRTFKSMIQSYVSLQWPLNKIYLPLYETVEGKKILRFDTGSGEEKLPSVCRGNPGTAEGAGVLFHKLFLLHMDEILPGENLGQLYRLFDRLLQLTRTEKPPTVISEMRFTKERRVGNIFRGVRLLTLMGLPPAGVFLGKEILGHNEDALVETLSHFYFVSAHIIPEQARGRWQVKEEKFTSLCYAGTLPGFTMSYNHHGFLFWVNIIRAKNMQAGKTPRAILTPALLANENLSVAEGILIDPGTSIEDAVSVNMIFLKQEGSKLFYNAEAAPTEFSLTDSLVNIITASPGEHIYHCNKFLRLNTPESSGLLIDSSKHRHKVMDSLPAPKCSSDIHQILGDESDKEFPMFRNEEVVKIIATGIFHVGKMTWSIFTDNPKTNDPIVELPILI